ncbi:TRAP transporter substrate-binding protein [Desulfofustis glycolicus]|uniref:Tripartite ATP-independent transporter solute receptor, DctP family n=1 Tax=Desulfofustis glycolicus DSM 9705 TaxID=1121409 RepID=A0A1M5ULW2_9BACT|nr:TRAP transporter substrate-binding protein [Desulfofustis glycolicus]MCB2217433.1 TRAP transporter substrate-binding protein [Desulfobulbaceae bacterium]SHH63713.1 tripartite ATP-independent transporter solute receptor, DctP family [Desulfofustis glycolicus DSM 9705]
MRKILSALVILVATCGFTASAAEAKMVLKLGHYANAEHAGNKAAQLFADGVASRTNGEMTVEIYPNNELGNPPEVLEQNVLGVIDMSLPTQGQLAKYSKKFGCVMLPFAYTGYDHAYKVLDGPFIEWAGQDLEDAGVVFLANWEWGFRNLTNSVRPVITPDDAKGLKIRTPPELSNQAAMEALGATVQTIQFSELPMALKQGVVDGQENPVSVIYAFKIYETQKYLTMTGHTYNSMVHVMSKKTWDKLSPEQQAIIREESKKAGDFMRQALRDAEADQIKKLEELGMKVTWPDVESFKAKMGPAYERMKASVGADNVTEFLKMVDEAK